MYVSFAARRLFPLGSTLLAVLALSQSHATLVSAQQTAAATLSFADVTDAVGMSSGNTGSHGAFWADATGDGLPDLFLSYNECRSGERANKFYRNLGGTFIEEATARGLFQLTGGTHGGAFADLDNDGDYDLVTGETYGEDCVDTEFPDALANRIYRNDGGVFVNRTPPDMAAYPDYTRSILAFDMERDGDLDIFAVNGDRGSGDPPDRNELYRNNGGLNFTGITTGALVTTPAGQAGTDTDYDGDGDVDILVPNFEAFSTAPGTGDLGVLRNDGNGNFTKVTKSAIGISHAATTGISTGDLNNDGRTDLVLIDQDRDPLRKLGFDRIAYIYLNAGGGTFSFGGEIRGIPGYTAGLADLDNDGDLDLTFPGVTSVLLNNGNATFAPGPAYPTPTPTPGCVSTACFRPDPRTVSFADVDNDGDLDSVVTVKFGVFRFIRNNLSAGGNFLKVQLTSPLGQAGAFGAKVRVFRTGTQQLVGFREAKNVYGYLSQDDPVLHFGLGTNATVDVQVTYLDGSSVTRTGVNANQTIAFFGTTNLTAPPAPTGLAANVAGNSVTVSWTAAPTASSYVLEAGSAPNLANLAIVNTPAPGLNAVAPNGTYYVRVRARNAAGVGPPSTEIVVVVGGGGGCTSAPSAPGTLSFTKSGSLVTLSWGASGGAPSTYLVEAGTGPGLANLVVFDIGGPGTTFAAQAPPGVYYVRIRARNACGTSAPSNEAVIPVP